MLTLKNESATEMLRNQAFLQRIDSGKPNYILKVIIKIGRQSKAFPNKKIL